MNVFKIKSLVHCLKDALVAAEEARNIKQNMGSKYSFAYIFYKYTALISSKLYKMNNMNMMTTNEINKMNTETFFHYIT